MAQQRSTAIRITRPPTSESPGPKDKGSKAGSPPREARNEKSQRLCRNITLYDQCKTPNCPFYHPPGSGQLETSGGTTVVGDSSPPKSSELKAAALQAPVFVPKSATLSSSSPSFSSPSLQPSRSSAPTPQLSNAAPEWSNSGQTIAASPLPQEYDDQSYDYNSMMAGGMFVPQQAVRPPLDYHLYTAPLAHLSNPPLGQNPLHSFFIPDDLRRMFTARLEALKWKPYVPPQPPPPAELGVYHDLVPLDPVKPTGSRVYGHPAPVYRATSTVDGNVYLLRRIEGYKVPSEAAFAALDTWRKLRHPNIVSLREAFTTKAFAFMLVYDFHPNSTTIWDEHLNQNPETVQPLHGRPRRQGMPIHERVLWSYITQIANALKAVHISGLAMRALDPNKILITGKNRLRLNGCGILDVLGFDPNTPVAAYQSEDMISFGKLILSMGCEFYQPGQHPAQAIDHLERVYSPDVKNLVMFLLGKPGPYKTFDEVLQMIGPRILNELDALQFYNDTLEDEAMREMENGRLVRVLSKMGFINERAEFEYDPRWADTGDRYIIKLFRDYVFHSVSPTGAPVLDLSHVITCLNKLDAGLDERIMLVTRDERSCLVVTYREIKNCIEAAYTDLRTAEAKVANTMGTVGMPGQRPM